MQASPETTVYRYIYAPDGLLARIDSSIAEQSTGWTVYHYDAAGSVESIHSEPGCGRDIARCESFTYYPNGQPHTVERYADTFWSTTDTYDERGRLVATALVDYDTMLNSTRSYDAAGRVTRIWEKGGVNYSSHETVTTFVYDSEGRLVLQRTAKDAVIQAGPGQAGPDRYTYTRATHRLTYICGTQIVWLDEWDSNEDGVPDARRTHERTPRAGCCTSSTRARPAWMMGPSGRTSSTTVIEREPSLRRWAPGACWPGLPKASSAPSTAPCLDTPSTHSPSPSSWRCARRTLDLLARRCCSPACATPVFLGSTGKLFKGRCYVPAMFPNHPSTSHPTRTP